ncbi:MAG: hypothetical protein JSR73_10165 [Proteobacteria bacterium]|nr:hypothetical protein [Pseudomonadota bacterium]
MSRRAFASLLLALSWAAASAPSAGDPPADEWFAGRKGDRLGAENRLETHVGQDFSSLFVPRSPLLGFVGRDFRRLYIRFTSVRRDPAVPAVYHVVGFTSVHGAAAGEPPTEFRGSVTVTAIREYPELHYGADGWYRPLAPRAEGALLGQYRFEESRDRAGSGVFEGEMALYWVLDRDGTMQYDDIRLGSSDGYRNNQYRGRWTSYRTGTSKPAHWGEYRVPDSGDLDVGVGEFVANPKYRQQGW